MDDLIADAERRDTVRGAERAKDLKENMMGFVMMGNLKSEMMFLCGR